MTPPALANSYEFARNLCHCLVSVLVASLQLGPVILQLNWKTRIKITGINNYSLKRAHKVIYTKQKLI